MKRIKGFKMYKSLFDKCLYKNLEPIGTINTYQIQVRQCDSTTHFSVYYTDGYKTAIKLRYAQGYDELKEKIEEIEEIHKKAVDES